MQGALEQALACVADAPVITTCAGRTDAGVHARCQVIHFDAPVQRSERGWVLGTTSRLPPAVCVRWCRPVDGAFHARFSATARRYRYRILNRSVRPALQRQYVSWVREPLDATAMHDAAQALRGENDFSAFRSAQCEASHARRDLQAIRVQRLDDVVTVEVQANAFLHHMVRNIVGSLLLGRDRTLAGPTAPAAGLTFLGPIYPRQWQLPEDVTE